MNFNLDFLRFRFIALIASVSFILVSLATISIQQLQLGLDFTGGTLVEVGFTETVDPEEIRTYLEGKQIDALVQAFGSDKDLLIKIPSSENIENANIIFAKEALRTSVFQLEPKILNNKGDVEVLFEFSENNKKYTFKLKNKRFVDKNILNSIKNQGISTSIF